MALTILDYFPIWHLTGSPAFITASTNVPLAPNIRLDLRITKLNWDGSFNHVYTDSLVPDSSGICTFEISEIFSHYIKPAFTFPDTGKRFTLHAEASSMFNFEILEYYGNPPELMDSHPVQSPVNVLDFYLVKGVLPQWAAFYFFTVYSSYYNRFTTGNHAMSLADLLSRFSNIPFKRSILKSDTQKIFIHLPVNVDAAFLKIDFLFSDETTGTYSYYPPPTQITGLKGQVMEFHAGYNAIGLDAIATTHFPGKTIKQYSVQPFTDPGTALNDLAYTYVLDDSYYAYRREFVFLTSLGGYDTLCFTGQSISENHYEYDVINTPFWPGVSDSLRRIYRTDFRPQVVCNTGILDKAKMIYLAEMLISTEIYEIINGKLMPIILADSTVLFQQDKDGLLYAELTYTYSPQISQQ